MKSLIFRSSVATRNFDYTSLSLPLLFFLFLRQQMKRFLKAMCRIKFEITVQGGTASVNLIGFERGKRTASLQPYHWNNIPEACYFMLLFFLKLIWILLSTNQNLIFQNEHKFWSKSFFYLKPKNIFLNTAAQFTPRLLMFHLTVQVLLIIPLDPINAQDKSPKFCFSGCKFNFDDSTWTLKLWLEPVTRNCSSYFAEA